MKLIWLFPAAVTAALMLTGCGGNASGEDIPAETTVPAVTTAAETTTETTTTTTTTLPYIVQEGVSLTYQTASARPTGCVMQMANSGAEPVIYRSGDFALYTADGAAIPEVENEEGEKPTRKITETELPAGEPAEITYAWGDIYGELSEGSYILEQVFDDGTVTDEETGEVTQKNRPTVLRTEFQIVGTDYAPVLTVDPATVLPTGCTLHITNAPDQPREYTPSYKVFEAETNNMYIREIDKDSKKNGLLHFEPGESRDITYNWSKVYGRLPDGKYELQVEFTGEEDKVAATYRVPFEVIT